jgi:hypothetical protein
MADAPVVSDCDIDGTAKVLNDSSCECYPGFTGAACELAWISVDYNVFAVYTAFLGVIMPIGNIAVLCQGIALLINKWRAKRHKTIAALSAYATVAGCISTYGNTC